MVVGAPAPPAALLLTSGPAASLYLWLMQPLKGWKGYQGGMLLRFQSEVPYPHLFGLIASCPSLKALRISGEGVLMTLIASIAIFSQERNPYQAQPWGHLTYVTSEVYPS